MFKHKNNPLFSGSAQTANNRLHSYPDQVFTNWNRINWPLKWPKQ